MHWVPGRAETGTESLAVPSCSSVPSRSSGFRRGHRAGGDADHLEGLGAGAAGAQVVQVGLPEQVLGRGLDLLLGKQLQVHSQTPQDAGGWPLSVRSSTAGRCRAAVDGWPLGLSECYGRGQGPKGLAVLTEHEEGKV